MAVREEKRLAAAPKESKISVLFYRKQGQLWRWTESMGYFFSAVWCIAFGAFGVLGLYLRRKHADYVTFTAKVDAVKIIKGRKTAILQSGIHKIGQFAIQFQDLGDFEEGDRVECMWDGKNPNTAQQDLRSNNIIGIVFCFAMVALMVVIILILEFVPLPDFVTVE